LRAGLAQGIAEVANQYEIELWSHAEVCGVSDFLAIATRARTITTMQRAFLILISAVFLSGTRSPAVAPIPESEQAARAMAIIDGYHNPRPEQPPKKLQLVYYTPADREPADQYAQRLEPIMEDIQAFYRDGMQRLGFGPKTFTLPRDTDGKLVIRSIKGKSPEAAFKGWEGRNGGNTGAPEGGDKVKDECRPALEAAGIYYDRDTVLIFCHLASWDATAKTFRHHSPYFGLWDENLRMCFVADWASQNLVNLTNKTLMLKDAEYGRMSLGKHTTIFLGGIAHELGHALALPHCGERWDEKAMGTSLMGAGNHTYREERRGEGKGSILTMSSAMRLAANPLFNGSDKGRGVRPQIASCKFTLSTNLSRADLAARPGVLRLEGTVTGTPAIYGVIAYFDSVRDGGYRAPSATSVPDAQGAFAIEVSDLGRCANGELRVEFCHVNGTVSDSRLGLIVSADGRVDLSQWELRAALGPVASAVSENQTDDARTALQRLEEGSTPETTKRIARKLVGTLNGEVKPSPAEAPTETAELALGDARATSAEVGWLKPSANRIPQNAQITSPLLDSGALFATGLYAHAPSKYVYDLGGKWKHLNGKAGLHTLQQPFGSVRFSVKADGREVYKSDIIRGATQADYKIDVTGVKNLELIVDPTRDGNANDWGLWLDPILSR